MNSSDFGKTSRLTLLLTSSPTIGSNFRQIRCNEWSCSTNWWQARILWRRTCVKWPLYCWSSMKKSSVKVLETQETSGPLSKTMSSRSRWVPWKKSWSTKSWSSTPSKKTSSSWSIVSARKWRRSRRKSIITSFSLLKNSKKPIFQSTVCWNSRISPRLKNDKCCKL